MVPQASFKIFFYTTPLTRQNGTLRYRVVPAEKSLVDVA